MTLNIAPSEFWQLSIDEYSLLVSARYNQLMIAKTGMDTDTLDRLLESSRNSNIVVNHG